MTDFHAFEKNGECFVFFPRSARLYQLSKTAARHLLLLSSRPDEPKLLVEPPYLQHGTVASPDPELSGWLQQLLRKERDVPPPSNELAERVAGGNSFHNFTLYLAQGCNMSCCYCWNRGGSFGKKPRLMGRQTARLVTELIVSLVESSSAATISVHFYGGEPLLNFSALQKITLELRRQEARLDKNFRFSLDTNGSLLKGKPARFLARHFSRVGVSLDGSREIHDRQRPGLHGEQTWQTIVDNLQNFPNPKALVLRGTLTACSDSYLDTFHRLSSLGVRRIQLEYCHDTGYLDDPSYQILNVPLERQLAEIGEFIDDYIVKIRNFTDPQDIPFVSGLLEKIVRIRAGNRFARPCGAGSTTIAINSLGEIFPCVAFADHKDFSMGRVGANCCLPLQETLVPSEVDDLLPCNSCWLRYDCGGGCYATHYSTTGHIQKPHPQYCRNMRGKAELYLRGLAQMSIKCPWHLDPAAF